MLDMCFEFKGAEMGPTNRSNVTCQFLMVKAFASSRWRMQIYPAFAGFDFDHGNVSLMQLLTDLFTKYVNVVSRALYIDVRGGVEVNSKSRILREGAGVLPISILGKVSLL